MDKNIVKNRLANKTCDTCLHKKTWDNKCSITIITDLPISKTCDSWQEIKVNIADELTGIASVTMVKEIDEITMEILSRYMTPFSTLYGIEDDKDDV